MNRSPRYFFRKIADARLTHQQEFQIADAHLRETLPPIIEATFNLVPFLLNGLVLVQNRLLGIYYTVLNAYCEDQQFPSPSPPMDQVVAAFNAQFAPARRELEQVPMIARGRAIRTPLKTNMDDLSQP